ncbi:MAG: hypothetical protein WAN99_04500 [Methanoculleus sp.]
MLTIIGEAAKEWSRRSYAKEYPEIPWREAAGMRDKDVTPRQAPSQSPPRPRRRSPRRRLP